MKKPHLSRLGITTIVLTIALGAVVITGISCAKTLLRTRYTVQNAWIALAGEYQRRDMSSSRLLEMAATDPEISQQALADVLTAQKRLDVHLDLRKPPESLEAFNDFNTSQGTFNNAMAKVLRPMLTNGRLQKDNPLDPVVISLVKSDHEIALRTNRFEVASQFYNAALQHYPARVYAGLLGFQRQASFLDVEPAQTLATSNIGGH